jgi:hypothetical protein
LFLLRPLTKCRGFDTFPFLLDFFLRDVMLH